MKKKVCVVITARASYSRIRSALVEMRKNSNIDLKIVLAASSIISRYGNIEKEVLEDGFEISEKVYNLVSGENGNTSAKTTGLGIIELSTIFSNMEPDMVVTIADRYETLATAVAASYMNIPLVHIQGGEVTGNIDEKVRHAITKLADLHLVSNDDARNRVISMGEEAEKIAVTGCPSIDIAKYVKDNYSSLKFDPVEKYGGVGIAKDDRSKYLVVMYHPVTTHTELLRDQVNSLLEIVDDFGVQVYWFWPNVDSGSDIVSNRIRSYREKGKNKNILFFKNMNPDDFLVLLVGSQCIIGNSSVGIRECSFLGVPAINIGDRQNRRVRGSNVIDIGDIDKIAIEQAYKKALTSERISENIYGDGKAGKRISDLLANIDYIDVNKVITY